jgi:surface protein
MSRAAVYVGTAPVLYLDSFPAPWTRPAWPPLDNLTPTNNVATGIYGVEDTDSNFVSVLVGVSTGTWIIDWGDGQIESGLASNVKRDHFYNYAAIGASPVNGYKPVVVKITTSGGNITTLNLQQKHSQAGLPAAAFRVNWLDFAVNAASMTSLTVGGATIGLDKLEQFKIYNHSFTAMNNMFEGCRSLQSIPLFNTSAVTAMNSVFSFCSSLKTVPLFVTSAVLDMAGMFQGCSLLESVPLFITNSVTNMGAMFNGCKSLQSVPLFTTTSATNMSSMFQACSSLKSVPLFPTSTVINMANMFNACSSLQSVPHFVTSAVTNMSSMFNDCVSLQSVPLFITNSVLTTSGMFQGCTSLQSVPSFVLSAATNTSVMFNTCTSLQSVPSFATNLVTTMTFMFSSCSSLRTLGLLNTSGITSAANAVNLFNGCISLSKGRTNGIQHSISYANCKLSAAAINDIFTGLGTASGAPGSQTITVAGNYGAATCTTSIATNKFWTVAA